MRGSTNNGEFLVIAWPLIDRLLYIDFVIGIAEEEEYLVALDRSAELATELVHLNIGLRRSLGTRKEFIRIQVRVAQKLE